MEKTIDHIPDKMAAGLPGYDQDAPFVLTESGEALVAGRYALIVGDRSGITDSGLWHEIQYASWEAQTRTLTVVWVDPERSIHRFVTVDDNPQQFMRIVTSRVNDTIVTTRQAPSASGATVTASIRRRIDGELFSTVIIQGKQGPDTTECAQRLEGAIRKEVGLEP